MRRFDREIWELGGVPWFGAAECQLWLGLGDNQSDDQCKTDPTGSRLKSGDVDSNRGVLRGGMIVLDRSCNSRLGEVGVSGDRARC